MKANHPLFPIGAVSQYSICSWTKCSTLIRMYDVLGIQYYKLSTAWSILVVDSDPADTRSIINHRHILWLSEMQVILDNCEV